MASAAAASEGLNCSRRPIIADGLITQFLILQTCLPEISQGVSLLDSPVGHHDVSQFACIPLASQLDVEHLLPHITSSSLAEFEIELDLRLESLDVVEDERESDET